MSELSYETVDETVDEITPKLEMTRNDVKFTRLFLVNSLSSIVQKEVIWLYQST
jgi:hypothetical protein